MAKDRRMKSRRKELHLKQIDVAGDIGISQSAYQAYEAGKRTPNARLACRFAKALQTTVEALWG